MFGVLAIHDGEIAAVAEQLSVLAEDAVADGMEGAAPERGEFLPEQIRDTPHHFGGGFVGERQEQDAIGWDALFEQIGDAIGEGARLARTAPAITRPGRAAR